MPLVISGATSGQTTIQATDAVTATITLPSTSGTVVVNNGAQTIEFADGSASAPSITNSGDTNTGIFFPAADTIAFAEGGVEAMRIDSSGNLGLGITPSNALSTTKALEIGQSGALYGKTSTNEAGLVNNYYQNSGGSVLYKNTGYANSYVMSTGEHRFYTAPSGTAGAAVTLTNTMTLDASGNLLVKGASAYFAVQGGIYQNSGLTDPSRIALSSAGGSTLTTYIGNQAITTSSDIRLKENVKPTERNAIELLSQWEIVDHTWNDPSDQCENNRNSRGVWTGVVAQQVQPITPWLVNKPLVDVEEDGTINTWTMDFGYAVPLLVKAIQELKAIVDTQAEQIKALQGAK